MTMANWFEDVTKTLADEKISRRTVMRRVAGTVAGAALASALPGAVLAKGTGKACPGGGGNCSIGFVNCKNNSNTNCYCFDGTKNKGAGHCGCNGFCSQLSTCVKNTDCPGGTFCSYFNTCNCNGGSGVCITTCAGKNKNCQLGSGHGATAAVR
jgi:hypothetical protein